MKRLIAVSAVLGLTTMGALTPAFADDETPGSSIESPIFVTDPDAVPDGATEDDPSTFTPANECATSRSWVEIVPGEVRNEETEEVLTQWKREVPAVEEVSHTEWTTYSRTREQSYDYEVRIYTFAINPDVKERGLGSPPRWPSDDRGEWVEVPPGFPQDRVKPYNTVVNTIPGQPDLSWFFSKRSSYPVYTDWSDWNIEESGLRDEPALESNTSVKEWKVESEKVVDVPAQKAYREYFVEGADVSRDAADASWTSERPDGDDWEIYQTKTNIKTTPIQDPDTTKHYVWIDNSACEEPGDSENPEGPETPDESEDPDTPDDQATPAEPGESEDPEESETPDESGDTEEAEESEIAAEPGETDGPEATDEAAEPADDDVSVELTDSTVSVAIDLTEKNASSGGEVISEPAAQHDAQASNEQQDGLAKTGASVAGLAGLAAALLIGGAAFVRRGVRRTQLTK